MDVKLVTLMRDVTRKLPTDYLAETRERGLAMGGTTILWPEVRTAIEAELAERGIALSEVA